MGNNDTNGNDTNGNGTNDTNNDTNGNGTNDTNGNGTNGNGTNGNGTNGNDTNNDTNGNETNGNDTNDTNNDTNGNGTNGNDTNGNDTNGNGTNGNGTSSTTPQDSVAFPSAPLAGCLWPCSCTSGAPSREWPGCKCEETQDCRVSQGPPHKLGLGKRRSCFPSEGLWGVSLPPLSRELVDRLASAVGRFRPCLKSSVVTPDKNKKDLHKKKKKKKKKKKS